MAMMTKQAKDPKINLADFIGIKPPMKISTRPVYTPPKKEKEVDPEIKAEGEKIKKEIERNAAEHEKASKDKMKKKSYLQFKQAFYKKGAAGQPTQPKPMVQAPKLPDKTSTPQTNNQVNNAGQGSKGAATPSVASSVTPAEPSVSVTENQKADGSTSRTIKGNPQDVQRVLGEPSNTAGQKTPTSGQQQGTGIIGTIVNGAKKVIKNPQGTIDAVKDGMEAGYETVSNGIKGMAQHSEMLQNNEAYNRGFYDPNNPIQLNEKSFNSEEWRNLKTDDERTAYITKLLEDWGYNKAGIAVRQNGMASIAKNPDLVPRDLGGVLKNDANYKELMQALSHGDMEFLNYLQRMQQGMGGDQAASFFADVWSSIPEEKQLELMGTMKTAAWNNIKADPIANIPKAIGLWFKMKGWDQMGEFAQNPLNFYLTLGGLLVGGTALAGAAFGGGSQQPIINVGNGQSNPFYNNEI